MSEQVLAQPVTEMNETTISKMFLESVAAHGEHKAQTWFDGEAWQSRTYSEYGAAVRDVANGLLSLGIKPGDRVAIWSKNSPRWAETDFANACVGFVTVPIYDTLTGPQGAYILNDSGAKVLFVQDPDMLARLDAVRKDVKADSIVLLEGTSRKKGVITYDRLIKDGQAYAKKEPEAFDKLAAKVKPSDLISLVYTSGTTGDPKGVMLTQNNFASNAAMAATCVVIGPEDTFLSFLPLSHVFERTGGHFTAYTVGAHVFFARSIDTLLDDMQIAKPTIMMSVPRLYEKIYSRINDTIKKSGAIKRFFFNGAMQTGMAANVYVQRNEPLPRSLEKKVAGAQRRVFAKLQARVGGNLRYFVSGGAALSQEIEEFFWAAGIKILQGYGLTETSPVITVNRPGHLRFGSVGKAVPGAEIRIDTSEWESQRTDVVEGEIIVKGPMVMQGYYNNKKATNEVMDKDGWFHTGDVGYIDEDGFVFITDRKKEIIVMSNGKNVAPQPIENRLKLQPHIAQACVIGDKKKYMSALICPDWEALETFALANGIAAKGGQLVSDQRVVSLIEKEVEQVNTHLARYEQIKKWWIVDQDWTVETGELTPSLKLKRRVISDKFGNEIEKLYPN